jgi:hypothetical protein
MQRSNRLVLDRFNRHRMNLLVSIRFEEALRVGAVSLVAPHVRSHIMRREQPNRMPQRLELSGPVVSGSAGLEHDRRRWPLREEG